MSKINQPTYISHLSKVIFCCMKVRNFMAFSHSIHIHFANDVDSNFRTDTNPPSVATCSHSRTNALSKNNLFDHVSATVFVHMSSYTRKSVSQLRENSISQAQGTSLAKTYVQSLALLYKEHYYYLSWGEMRTTFSTGLILVVRRGRQRMGLWRHKFHNVVHCTQNSQLGN